MKHLLFTEQEPARRGFLRSLVAAPVAALATHKLILPAQALVTPDDAATRLAHHLAGAEAAMRDLFPAAHIEPWGNYLGNASAVDCYRFHFERGDRGFSVYAGVKAAVRDTDPTS
ncbi:MAG: hypothetical protein ACR652_10130 [Methylocystis sp.]|uniref:hypothetical protein n=1 Tax=Methylocystis sp. TaxID=1911079 RepID=UPI003DA365A7